jgi:hypothetical protein
VTIDEMLAEEERMVGTPCRLHGHSVLDAGDDRIETIVYECGPREESRHPVIQVRWAVFVNGSAASSSIVGFRR